VRTPPKLCQNCAKTPSVDPRCVKTDVLFVHLPIQLEQSVALHLQLHLRILHKNLGVSLRQQLRDPFVRNAAGTQSRRVGGSQIVDTEIRNTSPPQSGVPDRLQSFLVPTRILITRK